MIHKVKIRAIIIVFQKQMRKSSVK